MMNKTNRETFTALAKVQKYAARYANSYNPAETERVFTEMLPFIESAREQMEFRDVRQMQLVKINDLVKIVLEDIANDVDDKTLMAMPLVWTITEALAYLATNVELLALDSMLTQPLRSGR